MSVKSVAGICPAEHRDTMNIVFDLLGHGLGGSFDKVLSTTPDPAHPPLYEGHPGFGLLPATHYAFNHEAVPEGMLETWEALKAGNIAEVFPEVVWGENDLPSEQDVIAACASCDYFQRVSTSLTPEQHFIACIMSASGMGAKTIYVDL